MTDKFKTVSLDTMIDKHIGKRGTERREVFENELRIDLLGQAIKRFGYGGGSIKVQSKNEC